MGAAPGSAAINGVTQRWAGRPRFVILDTGFGLGADFLAAWQAWRDDPDRPARLHYLALSAAPVPPEVLPAALRPDWPLALPGFHRITLEQGQLTLDLMVGAPPACLAQIEARVDAFILNDTQGPASALARLARPGALLLAPKLSARQRAALGAAGFDCGAELAAQSADRINFERDAGAFAAQEPGAAGTVGAEDARPARAVYVSRRPAPAEPDPGQRRAIVIGAGVAGSAACERLCARGWQVTLIERHAQPAQEASGNLAGIFMPQLSRDDNPASRLSRNAFLFALRQWRQLGGIGAAFAGAQCGVLQLARDAAHGRIQAQIAAAAHYPPQYARWLDPAAAAELLGAPAPDGGWLFGQGGWARPSTLCAALLDACGARLRRLFSASALELARADGEWQVRDAAGVALARAPTVILANGVGATALAQAAHLPLAAVRGQVTHLAPHCLPPLPLVVCREAYLTLPSAGVVCAGATYDADADPGLRAASQRENLDKIAALLGPAMRARAWRAPLAGRTGFRCVAPDRLPLVGALPDADAAGPGVRVERLRDVPRWPGLYALLGYASHGMTWAPLAAELLAAQLEGEPLPLEANLAAALDPGRFLLRAKRRAPD